MFTIKILHKRFNKANILKSLFASLMLMTLSSPTFALQFCALDLKNSDGTWDKNVIHADRGESFGKRVVNKGDDGDTCRSQGRRIGPDECQLRNAETGAARKYRIRAGKNSGKEKNWVESC